MDNNNNNPYFGAAIAAAKNIIYLNKKKSSVKQLNKNEIGNGYKRKREEIVQNNIKSFYCEGSQHYTRLEDVKSVFDFIKTTNDILINSSTFRRVTVDYSNTPALSALFELDNKRFEKNTDNNNVNVIVNNGPKVYVINENNSFVFKKSVPLKLLFQQLNENYITMDRRCNDFSFDAITNSTSIPPIVASVTDTVAKPSLSLDESNDTTQFGNNRGGENINRASFSPSQTCKNDAANDTYDDSDNSNSTVFDPAKAGLSPDFILTDYTKLKGCSCKVSQPKLMQLLDVINSNSNDRGSSSSAVGMDCSIIPLGRRRVYLSLADSNNMTSNACNNCVMSMTSLSAKTDDNNTTAATLTEPLYLISTTDFFFPSVDDPYLQGWIGAANVLSDLYAMGITKSQSNFRGCDSMLMLLAACSDMSTNINNDDNNTVTISTNASSTSASPNNNNNIIKSKKVSIGGDRDVCALLMMKGFCDCCASAGSDDHEFDGQFEELNCSNNNNCDVVNKGTGVKVSGGQTVINPWPLIGGVAMAVVAENDFIDPTGIVAAACRSSRRDIPPPPLSIGNVLVLTKPLGTQVAVNLQQWYHHPSPLYLKYIHGHMSDYINFFDHTSYGDNYSDCYQPKGAIHQTYVNAAYNMAKLNYWAGKLAVKHKATAATDITGFGLIGHACNLVNAVSETCYDANSDNKDKSKMKYQQLSILFHTLPILRGSVAASLLIDDKYKLLQGLSSETSGGLLVVLPSMAVAEAYINELTEKSDEKGDWTTAWVVGSVVPRSTVKPLFDHDNKSSSSESYASSAFAFSSPTPTIKKSMNNYDNITSSTLSSIPRNFEVAFAPDTTVVLV